MLVDDINIANPEYLLNVLIDEANSDQGLENQSKLINILKAA
jgi:hypothetical protein